MAYAGSTSTSPNPPVRMSQPITGSAMWVYKSTHISSDIQAANFFTDGQALGMTVGDSLLHVGSTTYVITSHAVTVVGSTTTTISVGSTFAA